MSQSCDDGKDDDDDNKYDDDGDDEYDDDYNVDNIQALPTFHPKICSKTYNDGSLLNIACFARCFVGANK